jgi:hypothetical protein
MATSKYITPRQARIKELIETADARSSNFDPAEWVAWAESFGYIVHPAKDSGIFVNFPEGTNDEALDLWRALNPEPGGDKKNTKAVRKYLLSLKAELPAMETRP